MSEKKVSRRGYMKYAGAGIVVVAAAGAGTYFATRPPGVTETTTSTKAPSLPMTTPNKRYKIVFSNGEMADPWRWVFVQDMENWAKKYRELGPGIDFIWTNALSDSAKQLADCETLLAMSPNALILSPYESAPLDPVLDKCNKAGVPLFCIDRTIKRQPQAEPGSMYIQAIVQDWFYSGRARAKLLADLLTRKNGEPKGNVVEIDGTVGSSPQIEYSVGIEDYLARMNNYKDIKILDSQDGDWNADKGLRIIEDYLSRFPKGEIDAVFSHGDIMSIPSVETAKRMGRDELLGYITGQDCYRPWLEMVLSGEGAFSVECPPYYGYAAFESVMKYLNGETVPPKKAIPTRNYTNWMNKDILAAHIEYCKKENLDYPPAEVNNYDELRVDVPEGAPDWWHGGTPPSSNLVKK